MHAFGNSLRMARMASMPLISGICRFIKVMSGRCALNFSTASRPVDASATISRSASRPTREAIPLAQQSVVGGGENPNPFAPAHNAALLRQRQNRHPLSVRA